MNSPGVVRFIPRLLNVVVLFVSGAYLLVYLYRWEWNRAVISGMFFIAAEIALATSLILAQLRRQATATESMTARTITDVNAAKPAQSFAWLARNDRMGVFIPVLLGAGVILSALAYLVERIAGAVAGPTVDRHSARLMGLDLPLGAQPSHAQRSSSPRPSRARGRASGTLGWLVAAAAALVLVVAGIDVLADATQSRLSEHEATSGSTTVVLDVDQKNLLRPDADLAEALWVVCRSVATPDASLERVRPVGGDKVEVVIRPAMGELRRRRVFGCFEDAVIDRVDVDVVDWSER
jgi:hypothetical protein